MSISIQIHLLRQSLQLFDGQQWIRNYPVSTGKNGIGEQIDSGKTPRGGHTIYAKIGGGAAANTVFVGRVPTGEIYTADMRQQHPGRDWILTRIMWLAGLEPGINQGGEVDTLSRYIYIHGCPSDVQLGIPGSKGCIRMYNDDIIELFDLVAVGTRVSMQED